MEKLLFVNLLLIKMEICRIMFSILYWVMGPTIFEDKNIQAILFENYSEFTSGVELTLSNIDLRNYLSHDVSVFSA